MYILDSTTNTLQKAEICKFKDLNLKEREHLQEWIANEPTSLGEDLLIIQKEFDGFPDTRERLDLLALDEKGHLVIIENKLDDSGRDVTWQAIKYASYCASLTKEQIISIFQKHLGPEKDARKVLSDFFNEVDLDEIELNPENSQRIIFVAANFRKEVTSSVLWLSNFGLKIKCFKVTPYLYNGRILIDFDQIIPVKDAEDYTIKMVSKKQEASQTAEASIQRRNDRHAFWIGFIEYNKLHSGLFASSTGSHDGWLMKSLGTSGIAISVIVNKDVIKTEVTINSGDKDYNKEAFDFLQSHKEDIEKSLIQYPLLWLRNDDRIMCNIRTEKPGLSYSNPEHRKEIYDFLMTSTKNFYNVFHPLVRKYINGSK